MTEICLNFIFTILLCAAGVWDLMYHRIPDRLCAGLLAVGIGAAFCTPQPELGERLLGSLAVSVPLLLISLLIPGAFGGGDVKLTAAGGFFLGARGMADAFLLAMLGSGGAGLFLLLGRKKGEGRLRIPIGPFLCAGMLAILYCGGRFVLS